MGHVPSAQYVTEPFVLDMFSTKNSCERLVALALTKHNFPSSEDPLFLKFCAVRAENPVRHWYCRPKEASMDDLPEVPGPEELYQRFVEGATAVCARNLSPEHFTPLPIMLVKMDDNTSTERPNGENCSVVGYFGCRAFSSTGAIGDECVLGIFLSTRFYNEAKSLSSIQLACKCYRHFCLKAGCKAVPWPPSIRYDTFQSNLPCLRLTQKLHSLVEAHGVVTEKGITITKDCNRAFFMTNGEVVRLGSEKLAERVTDVVDEAGKHHFTLRPETIPQPSLTQNVRELNGLIADAKARWSDANAAVVRSQLQQSRQTRKDRHDEIQASERAMRERDGGGGARSRKGSTASQNAAPASRVDSPQPATTAGGRQPSSSSSVATASHEAGGSSSSEQHTKPRRASGDALPSSSGVTPPGNLSSGRTLTPPSLQSSPAKASPHSNGSVASQCPAVLPGLTSLPIGASLVGPPSPNSSMAGQPVFSMNSSLTSSNASLAGLPVFHGEVAPGSGAPEFAAVTEVSHQHVQQHQPYSPPQTVFSLPTLQQPHYPTQPFVHPVTAAGTGHTGDVMVHNGLRSPSYFASQQAINGGTNLRYSIAHYPRDTVPLRRTVSNAAVEATQPWAMYRAQASYAPYEHADFRVFLGERTPVYVCTNRRQWEPLYWRNPLSPLRRSTWQPHVEDRFVCFECDHTDLQLFDQYWHPVVQPSEALLFVEANETIYTLDEGGNYVAGLAQ